MKMKNIALTLILTLPSCSTVESFRTAQECYNPQVVVKIKPDGTKEEGLICEVHS